MTPLSLTQSMVAGFAISHGTEARALAMALPVSAPHIHSGHPPLPVGAEKRVSGASWLLTQLQVLEEVLSQETKNASKGHCIQSSSDL